MKKQGSKNKKAGSSRENPVNRAVFLLGLFLILLGIFGFLYHPEKAEEPETKGSAAFHWNVSEAGILSFSPRGTPVYSAKEIADTYSPKSPDALKLLSFESQGEEIKAFLRIPGNRTAEKHTVPGIVLLPGAGISKEKEQGLARELSALGYATLTLDERNLAVINPDKDLEFFKAGLEPLEYKMVYDALKAFDVLAAQPEIDNQKIAIIGESNGGRFAIIASSLEPKFRGVIGISTSGYGSLTLSQEEVGDKAAYRFYRSIDPDSYLESLPPKKFVLMHSFKDPVIRQELAAKTFSQAKEPKAMYNVNEAVHGYTGSMKPYLEKELSLMLN